MRERPTLRGPGDVMRDQDAEEGLYVPCDRAHARECGVRLEYVTRTVADGAERTCLGIRLHLECDPPRDAGERLCDALHRLGDESCGRGTVDVALRVYNRPHAIVPSPQMVQSTVLDLARENFELRKTGR